MMKPDGWVVTVSTASAYPGAWAVMVVVPLAARPCTKMLPTLAVVTLVKVTVLLPSTVALLPLTIVAMPVEATVTVTVTGPGGVAPSEIDSCVCRFSPTAVVVTPPLKRMPGAVTVAVITRAVVGVLKPRPGPDGGTTWICVVPTTAGSNATLSSSPRKIAVSSLSSAATKATLPLLSMGNRLPKSVMPWVPREAIVVSAPPLPVTTR